jgi:hypothetical protein
MSNKNPGMAVENIGDQFIYLFNAFKIQILPAQSLESAPKALCNLRAQSSLKFVFSNRGTRDRIHPPNDRVSII